MRIPSSRTCCSAKIVLTNRGVRTAVVKVGFVAPIAAIVAVSLYRSSHLTQEGSGANRSTEPDLSKQAVVSVKAMESVGSVESAMALVPTSKENRLGSQSEPNALLGDSPALADPF